MSLRSGLLALAVLWIAACSAGPETGPAKVAWDRDTCDRCRMTISEPRFAAQVRDHDHRAQRFDDLGCALLWLDEQGDAPPPLEIWVGDAQGEGWLDARSASYAPGMRTPMGYGFGARAPGGDGPDLATVWDRIRKQEGERRSRSRN